MNNVRSNHIINTPNGPMTVTKAARVFGLEARTVFERISLGWPEDRLLVPSMRKTTCIETPDGPMTVTEAERKYGLPKDTVARRLKAGWDQADLFLPPRPIHKKR